jgi:hypothetical protein
MKKLLAAVVTLAALLLVGCGGGSGQKQSQNQSASQPSGADVRFTRSNYAELVSDPERHKGDRVNIVGQVFSVERDAKGTYIQMWADPKNSDWNTVVGYPDPALQVAGRDHDNGFESPVSG